MLEVELKFRIQDAAAFEAGLRSRTDVVFDRESRQADQYFEHPCRDLAAADEAFRIRRETDHACLTWKGPRLDSTTKTREELECDVTDPIQADRLQLILIRLGFRPQLTVSKLRREFHAGIGPEKLTVAIDEVDELGSFVELEIISPEENREAATRRLQDVARELGLIDSEQRSYRQLLQDK